MKSVRGGRNPGTYVACLDCGKELAYDWGKMQVAKAITVPAARLREVAVR